VADGLCHHRTQCRLGKWIHESSENRVSPSVRALLFD
jgi:hypothetical protein